MSLTSVTCPSLAHAKHEHRTRRRVVPRQQGCETTLQKLFKFVVVTRAPKALKPEYVQLQRYRSVLRPKAVGMRKGERVRPLNLTVHQSSTPQSSSRSSYLWARAFSVFVDSHSARSCRLGAVAETAMIRTRDLAVVAIIWVGSHR